MSLFSSSAARAAFVALALCALPVASPVLAQAVSVTLNGSPMNLSPAPQERAGRIFVPLRGIFEQLGASVVYQSGLINAQGNGNSVSLHIGSTQATVNGQPQSLDVAPFVIGASTYVPLRFVSQALGAQVNYDAANKIVAISSGGPSAPPPPANGSRLRVGRFGPDRDAVVAARRPAIEAQFFGARADPNSLKITLDDLDITTQTSRSPSGFVYSPPSDLQSMRHVVRITGSDLSGAPFQARWSFTSGTSAVVDPLRVDGLPNGAIVGNPFTVTGSSLPGALVVVQAGAAGPSPNSLGGEIGSIFGVGGGASVRNEVTANPNGTFSTVISISAPPGTNLQLVVSSTDPRTKAAARPVRRLVTIR